MTAEPSGHPWPYLLECVVAVEVLECERCGGRLRIVELLSGKLDEIPEQAFYMKGNIEEVKAAAEKMAKAS